MLNNIIRKPMLAATLKNIEDIEYPVLCSEKLDGIRCLIVNSKAVSRTFKPIPNVYVRGMLERVCKEGFDGELVVIGKSFSGVSSGIMSTDGQPNFIYKVFDYIVNPEEGYKDRMKRLSELSPISNIRYVLPTLINNEKDILKYESQCLSEGYEGVMIRSVDGGYKFGRSTLREGLLLKLKRFTDSEAVILDVYEQMTNLNDAELDNFGHTKRSSCKDGKVNAGTLGGFEVKDINSDISFKIGTGDGLNAELRKKIWLNRGKYIGKIIKYKSQESGKKDKPRFPVFLGIRSNEDM